jgi:hypothetical protein
MRTVTLLPGVLMSETEWILKTQVAKQKVTKYFILEIKYRKSGLKFFWKKTSGAW